MIPQKLQREVIIRVVPNLDKTIDERIVQRTPGVSSDDRLLLRRSILAHLLAKTLVGASKEEVATVADLVGALVNVGNQQKTAKTNNTTNEETSG